MEGYHGTDLAQFSAYSKLQKFIETRRAEPGSFEEFEVALGEQMRALENEVKAEQLARYDVDAQTIVVAGVTMNLCLKKEKKRYLTSSGPVEVARNLFRPSGGGKSVCPLELRAGVVGGICAPAMARMVTYAMGHMTSAESAALFREFGIEGPSSSTCDRIPKMVGEAWEAHRVEWEQALRTAETVPTEAKVLAASLDGVMVPDKQAQAEAKAEREMKRKSLAKATGGPAGYREVGCGTVSLFDAEGNRLQTIRYGRAPEAKKKTLTEEIEAEVEAILATRRDLILVALADGAEENWRFFDGPRWAGATKIVDYGHASQHLKAGLAAYYGEESVEGRAEYERLKIILKEQAGGVDTAIEALLKLERSLRSKARASARQKKLLRGERKYFENQRERMDYAGYIAKGLPIGSGVVEAACKTLATQRMKRSGMSWGDGKQAILTIRSLQQSERWQRGWRLVAASFQETPLTVVKRGGLKCYELPRFAEAA
ncbi:MAG TPA: hypothetical protein VK592_09275 [Candidatus Dormibacteraeota bacterium]|nr:hypothetical protein [Candidatus Dormibacteraeota bacterium]